MFCKRDTKKAQPGFEHNPNLHIKQVIRKVVNGRFVLTLMTFVTLFALIGVSLSKTAFLQLLG